MSLKLFCLFFFVRLSTSESTAPVSRRSGSHCDSANRNSLIEHFFNVIFSEFYATPPVCACVQMCAGDSTYCYPNGCLKGASIIRDERDSTKNDQTLQSSTQSLLPTPKKQYMMVSDDKFDFMTDFLERNYVDESQAKLIPAQDLRPDPFKDKFSVLGKLKRRPKVELRYNIRDQVKNSKSDLVKNEGVDLTKTRWPLKQLRNKLNSEDNADVGKVNFFTKMLVESNVVEYPPKYFKRDITRTPIDEEEDKNSYIFEKSMNRTDYNNFSLESLIDTLIKNSFVPNVDTTNNAKEDESEIEKSLVVNADNLNSSPTNDATKVVSMNLTNENVEKNKYVDSSNINKTKNINEMITSLEKEIESQNNTSMEVAKRIVGGFEEHTHHNFKQVESDPNDGSKKNILQTANTNTDPTIHVESETATPKEFQPTKKNRQRFVRKLSSSKFN